MVRVKNRLAIGLGSIQVKIKIKVWPRIKTITGLPPI